VAATAATAASAADAADATAGATPAAREKAALRRPRAASLPVIRYFYLAHFVQCSARRPWVIRRHRSVLQCPLLVVLTYRAVFTTEVFYNPTPYRPVFSRIFLRACKTSRGG